MFKRHFITMMIMALVSIFITITAFANTKEVIFRVEGMTCNRCAASLTKTLRETPGVVDAKADYEKHEA